MVARIVLIFEIHQRYPLCKQTQRKKYMVISLMLRKHLTKSNTRSYKRLGKIRNSGPIPDHNKNNIQQTSSQKQTKWREAGSHPTKIRDQTRLPTFSLPIQYGTQNLSQSNQTTKGGQVDINCIGKVKQPLFADDTVLDLSDSKISSENS